MECRLYIYRPMHDVCLYIIPRVTMVISLSDDMPL